VALFVGRGQQLSDGEADAILRSPQGRQIARMMTYTAVGSPPVVRDRLQAFAEEADADELIVVHSARDVEPRLRSVELLADVSAMAPA
jgi:alkanesulfonate monooxygenase SsuD/methylene tetrahydromethanopterin reductase-like flavin-dependent oxidoreductase (luciferase family)